MDESPIDIVDISTLVLQHSSSVAVVSKLSNVADMELAMMVISAGLVAWCQLNIMTAAAASLGGALIHA